MMFLAGVLCGIALFLFLPEPTVCVRCNRAIHSDKEEG